MRRELTNFQIECEKGITTALEQLGKRIADRRIDGVSETYITGCIQDSDITFWIYADGADFRTANEHRVFERLDYESLVELGCAFIEALLKTVQRQAPN